MLVLEHPEVLPLPGIVTRIDSEAHHNMNRRNLHSKVTSIQKWEVVNLDEKPENSGNLRF